MPGLTVCIEHVAALRQIMQTPIPDPAATAILAEMAGADGISTQLHQDRRYIHERDLRLLRQTVHNRLILQLAVTSEMMGIALEIKPERVVLIPKSRKDGSTDNGLDLMVHGKGIFETVDTLQSNGISVGICIAPDPDQAKLAHQMRADWIYIHTGSLTAAASPVNQFQELDKIIDTIKLSQKLRLRIAVGHGLDYHLIKLFKGLTEIDEFSIGRSIIARALLKGMDAAVQEMLTLIRSL